MKRIHCQVILFAVLGPLAGVSQAESCEQLAHKNHCVTTVDALGNVNSFTVHFKPSGVLGTKSYPNGPGHYICYLGRGLIEMSVWRGNWADPYLGQAIRAGTEMRGYGRYGVYEEYAMWSFTSVEGICPGDSGFFEEAKDVAR
jgi:hypothetical protein